MIIRTPRVLLEPISPDLARRIIARDEQPGDRWHPEYPFADELAPLGSLARSGHQDPDFSLYLLRRVADGLAVGGFGFFGPPDADGSVEFGYGLVAAARGEGLATEAVVAALRFAGERGARRAAADTDLANLASQRVLVKAGLRETHRDAALAYFARDLPIDEAG